MHMLSNIHIGTCKWNGMRQALKFMEYAVSEFWRMDGASICINSHLSTIIDEKPHFQIPNCNNIGGPKIHCKCDFSQQLPSRKLHLQMSMGSHIASSIATI